MEIIGDTILGGMEMNAKIYLKIGHRSVVMSDPNDEAKLRYQGDGFDVLVWTEEGVRDVAKRHAEIAHAALVAVQACGGRCGQLRDVSKRPSAKRTSKRMAEANAKTAQMFPLSADDIPF